MTVALVWSDRALLRMAEIGDFLAERSPRAAEQLLASLFDRAEVLAEHPAMGVAFPGAANPDIRVLYLDKYRLFYSYDEVRACVTILTVRHAPQAPLSLEQVLDDDEP